MGRLQTEATVDDIIERLSKAKLLHVALEIAARRHVAMDALLGRVRGKTVAAGRHELIEVLYVYFDKSIPEVGFLIGRDTSTVWHSLDEQEIPRREAPGVKKAAAARRAGRAA